LIAPQKSTQHRVPALLVVRGTWVLRVSVLLLIGFNARLALLSF